MMTNSPHERVKLSEAALEADRGLTEINALFDFLLYVSPSNVDEEWHRFQSSGREEPDPAFDYVPLSFDPSLIKRELFNLPLEQVEDPDVATLFAEKRDELDRQITLLEDRNTPKFRPGAIQLYGDVSEPLVRLAEVILNESVEDRTYSSGCISSEELGTLARSEIDRYRAIDPSFDAEVKITDEIVAGMMVSGGMVLISTEFTFRRDRIDSLLQHEIGTHLVTYYNGVAQPLKIFSRGLAGYESLQEGLAVMSEWVTGGLAAHRLRTLAARVVAVHSMLDDSSFADTYRILHKDWEFSPKRAFNIATRAHRGGGFPKDAVYLEGLRRLHETLSQSVDRKLLFVGKIAFEHIPIVERLLKRGILLEPRFTPRYLIPVEAEREFERISQLSILQMTAEIN